jgi:type VI secretion system protein ImpG
MREYFEAEMRLLRDAAQEFAENYPEQAQMLNLNTPFDCDPYVERLLEGFAFLTAHIRQKIDDGIPEICENLLQKLWPQMLNPLPSMTIMQFKIASDGFTNTSTIPKATLVKSLSVGDKNSQECLFQTALAMEITPLRLIKVTVSEEAAGGCLLKLNFKSEPETPLKEINLRNLRFYIHGDSQEALFLYFLLVKHTRSVKLTFSQETSDCPSLLPLENPIPEMLSDEEIISPNTGKSFLGYHLLQEYFAFREKYLFISILGFEKVNWPENIYSFTLFIHAKITLPHNFNLTEDNFCLNCVPAINLFTRTAEPIVVDEKRLKYHLVADLDQKENLIIHSVRSVSASTENGIYNHKLEHNHFTITRCDENLYLILNSNDGKKIKNLSCEISVCNGNYPYRYICEKQPYNLQASLFGIKAFNLTKPTPMYFPKDYAYFCWTLVSHLSLNYSSISSVKNLRSLLNTYNWTDLAGNARRINSIIGVNVKPITSIRRGAIAQGFEFQITLRDSMFASLADIHLFGLVLHHFFSMYVWFNFFVLTKIICDSSGKELIWQPITGMSCPL